MEEGTYYLMGDDGFGRLVTIAEADTALQLEPVLERRARSFKEVYIIYVVSATSNQSG